MLGGAVHRGLQIERGQWIGRRRGVCSQCQCHNWRGAAWGGTRVERPVEQRRRAPFRREGASTTRFAGITHWARFTIQASIHRVSITYPSAFPALQAMTEAFFALAILAQGPALALTLTACIVRQSIYINKSYAIRSNGPHRLPSAPRRARRLSGDGRRLPTRHPS